MPAPSPGGNTVPRPALESRAAALDLCPRRPLQRHTWTKVSLPGSPVVEKAVSPDDMWVLCATSTASTPTYVLMHWDGSTWASVPVPTATPPAGANEYLGNLAASGPTDVWLQRIIQKGTSGARTLYLLHWDGTAWTNPLTVS